MTRNKPHSHDLHYLQPPPVTITVQHATSHQDTTPFSMARPQDGLSAIAFSGRGGGVSEWVPDDQDLILTSDTYGLYERGQVTCPVSKSISSHIRVGEIIASHIPQLHKSAVSSEERMGVQALCNSLGIV